MLFPVIISDGISTHTQNLHVKLQCLSHSTQSCAFCVHSISSRPGLVPPAELCWVSGCVLQKWLSHHHMVAMCYPRNCAIAIHQVCCYSAAEKLCLLSPTRDRLFQPLCQVHHLTFWQGSEMCLWLHAHFHCGICPIRRDLSWFFPEFHFCAYPRHSSS